MDMEIVFPGGKRVDALYKGFTIRTDQSRDDGGEASAPAPFDLFLASLGTCAGIYVLNFCEERGVPGDKISLVLRTEKAPGTRKISKVIIDIKLPADFPEKYKKAVIKAAGLCTVKKVMQDPPAFEISADQEHGI